MKKVLKIKNNLILLFMCILLALAVFTVGCGKKDTKKKAETKTEQTDKKDSKKDDKNTTEDEKIIPNEDGLSVESGAADTIDGSGDWDETKEQSGTNTDTGNNKKEQSDDKKDTAQDDNTNQDDSGEQDSGNMDGDNVLVDDKVWGPIN